MDSKSSESTSKIKQNSNAHVTKIPLKFKEGSKTLLIVCFFGIFVSYFIYGLLQEHITKSRYGTDNEKFVYTLALVFIQCIINSVFAQLGIMWSTPSHDNAPQTLYAAMSFSYLGAMLASNHALQFVSYPTQVLGKSIKPIPVMIFGVLYAGKRYAIQKYIFVLLITLGVALFTYKDSAASKAGLDSDHTFGWGEFFLLLSLGLDGMTGGIQDRIRSDFQTQTYRMMLYLNIWSIFYLFIALIFTGEGLEFIAFAGRFPGVLISMLAFSVLSAIGQIFIFMTVTFFGPLTCSIITTTRKFFTILASVIVFQHPMIARQWLGTLLVFIGLTLDSFYGKSPKSKDLKS